MNQEDNNKEIINKSNKKIKIGLIIGIIAFILIVIGVIFLLKKDGNDSKLSTKNNNIRLYSDNYSLVDGKMQTYKIKGDYRESNINIYKVNDYIVAYHVVLNDYNHTIGDLNFALYNIDKDKDFVVYSYASLEGNIDNVGHASSHIEQKKSDYTNINNYATEYANKNSTNMFSYEKSKVKKINENTTEVITVKKWKEEEYSFFKEFDEKNILVIKYWCDPTSCNLESEEKANIIKTFENINIEIVKRNKK